MRFVSLPLVAGLAALATGAIAADAPPRGYDAACGSCHENNGYGVQRLAERLGKDKARLSQRTDLPAEYIRGVVRRGFLSMPAMSKVEVSDAELDGIVRELSRRPASRP